MTYTRKTRPAPWLAMLGRKPTERKPRRSIARRSKREAGRMREYRAKVKEWLKGKRCVVCPHIPATETHHVRGRLGPLLLDERGWLPVSQGGHRWIHTNIKLAREQGWICERGLWGVPF